MTDDHHSDSSRTPLISIGLTVMVVLLIPIVIYSVGPEGPLKIGDVVFATDRHRVKFVDSTISLAQGYRDFCILESRVQLVVQKINLKTEDVIVAEPISTEKAEFPYCPPRTAVFLHPYQATLKAAFWGGIRDTLSRLVSER